MKTDKDIQLSDLLVSCLAFSFAFYLWMELQSTKVMSLSLVDGVFVIIAADFFGSLAIFTGLYILRAAFIYFFD